MSIFESLVLLTGVAAALSILFSLSRALGAFAAFVSAVIGLVLAHDPLLVIAAISFIAVLCAGRWIIPNRRQPNFSYHRFDHLRELSQNGFAIALIIIAIQYALYNQQIQDSSLWITRPSIVDIYIPISAGVAIRAWIEQGLVDMAHPSAVVMFLTLVVSALLTKRAFCSWVCGIGFLSETLYRRFKHRWKGKTIPAKADQVLRGFKYLFLLWLGHLIFSIPGDKLIPYLESEKHIMADLAMWHHMTQPGVIGALFIAAMVVLSTIKRYAFCHYVCPYGALMGIVSLASPFKIRRNKALCLRSTDDKDCRKCQQACPNNIPVQEIETVRAPDCHACHRCAQACPKAGALTLSLPQHRYPVSAKVLLLTLLFFVTSVPLLSYLTGYWQSATPEALRQAMIPLLDSIPLLPTWD